MTWEEKRLARRDSEAVEKGDMTWKQKLESLAHVEAEIRIIKARVGADIVWVRKYIELEDVLGGRKRWSILTKNISPSLGLFFPFLWETRGGKLENAKIVSTVGLDRFTSER